MAKHRPWHRTSRRSLTLALLVFLHLLVTPLPGRALVAGTWKSISVGGNHICGIAKDDTAWCWGYNGEGAVGDGTSTDRSAPTRVLTTGGLPDDYKAISAGADHTCAIALDDTAWCWGSDADGELGEGDGLSSSETSPVPVKTSGLPATYKRIYAGYFSTCAIASNDTAWCWGYNLRGKLGNGTLVASDVPVAVSTTDALPDTYKAISMGDLHACAIAGDDSAWCWGDNVKLQLGLVSGGPLRSSVPVPVETVSPVPPDVLPDTYAAIAAGRDHGCALTAGGVAWCWAEGFDGEVGTGVGFGSDVPIQVDTSGDRPSTYTEIDGGGWFTCAIASGTGAPWCWGDDAWEQLGNGADGDQNAPDAVVVGTEVPYHGLSAGATRVCALANDDTAWCWGNPVGTTDETETQVPVQVMGGVVATLAGLAITYTGDTYLASSRDATLRAQLGGPESCLEGVEVTFAFDSDGDGEYGEDPDDIESTTGTTGVGGVATATYAVTSASPGPIYDIQVSVEEDVCNAASNTGVLVVAGTGDASNGGGWYNKSGTPGVGRVNFGYTVQVKNGSRIVAGQISWHTTGATKTRFKGTITAFTRSCPSWYTGTVPSGQCAYVTGTGKLSMWTDGAWQVVASGIGFRVVVFDGGTSVSCNKKTSCTTVLKPDHFLMDFPSATVPGESTSVLQLNGGNLVVR